MSIRDCTHSVDGTPIKIYEVYESKIHGAYYDHASCEQVIAAWNNKGENVIPCNYTLDLYTWQDEIPWDVIIPEIQWVAMDNSGSWYGYTYEPIIDAKEKVLNGERFVFTEKMSKSREEMHDLCEKMGGIPQKSLNKSTDYLVMGENIGQSKVDKARKYGTLAISEDEFMGMVK